MTHKKFETLQRCQGGLPCEADACLEGISKKSLPAYLVQGKKREYKYNQNTICGRLSFWKCGVWKQFWCQTLSFQIGSHYVLNCRVETNPGVSSSRAVSLSLKFLHKRRKESINMIRTSLLKTSQKNTLQKSHETVKPSGDSKTGRVCPENLPRYLFDMSCMPEQTGSCNTAGVTPNFQNSDGSRLCWCMLVLWIQEVHSMKSQHVRDCLRLARKLHPHSPSSAPIAVCKIADVCSWSGSCFGFPGLW